VSRMLGGLEGPNDRKMYTNMIGAKHQHSSSDRETCQQGQDSRTRPFVAVWR
jgi:hypothetical protein